MPQPPEFDPAMLAEALKRMQQRPLNEGEFFDAPGGIQAPVQQAPAPMMPPGQAAIPPRGAMPPGGPAGGAPGGGDLAALIARLKGGVPR